MLDKRLFHYSTLRAYNSYLYDTLLYEYHVVSDTMVEMEVQDVSFKIPLAQGYFAKKNRTLYLIDKETLHKLPVKIIDKVEEKDGKKIFYVVTNAPSFEIKPIKTMSFKELIHLIAPFNHTNTDDWTLYKIICLASYCSRTFLRISTNPGFGKDSIKGVLHNLTSKVNIITPRSVPAVMRELTCDGELVFNEAGGMKSEVRQVVEDMILRIGEGSVTYINGALRSAAHHTKDKYDVHMLSITTMFNRVQDYDSKDDFFEKQFKDIAAVKDRLLPIKLNGLITEGFKNDFDYNKLMKENTKELASVIKNIEHWKVNYLNEQKPYSKPSHSHNGRHKQTLDVLFSFINLYCDSQSEFDRWSKLLLDRIQDYYNMIKGEVITKQDDNTANALLSEQGSPNQTELKINLTPDVIEESLVINKVQDLSDEEYSFSELISLGWTNEDVDKYLEDGDIFEVRPGTYRKL